AFRRCQPDLFLQLGRPHVVAAIRSAGERAMNALLAIGVALAQIVVGQATLAPMVVGQAPLAHRVSDAHPTTDVGPTFMVGHYAAATPIPQPSQTPPPDVAATPAPL